MHTLITDIVAVTAPTATPNGTAATVSLQFIEECGAQVGRMFTDAATLREAAHQLLAIAEASALHVAAPEQFALPPRTLIKLTSDVMTREAA